MAGSAFGAPRIITIDAEGLDLKDLDAAPETIVHAQIVLIEAAFLRKNSVLATSATTCK